MAYQNRIHLELVSVQNIWTSGTK